MVEAMISPHINQTNVPSGGATAVLVQTRQYPLLNFTMAKSACAGAAVAVMPSASVPIANRIFFIAK